MNEKKSTAPKVCSKEQRHLMVPLLNSQSECTICDVCEKDFITASRLKKHKSRKNPCKKEKIIYWKDVNVELDISHMNKEKMYKIIKESIEEEETPLKIVDKILERTKEYVEENELNKKCIIMQKGDKYALVKTEKGVEKKLIDEAIDEHEKILLDIAYNKLDGKEAIKIIQKENEDKWNKLIAEVEEINPF